MFTRFFNWITSRKVLRVLLVILIALLLVAITLGLWYLNYRYRLESDLLSPFPRLHPYWLPLLFLLVLCGGVLGWLFFRLLTDPRDGRFPDIDAAWSEGMAVLDAAGIDTREVPLFLVLGRPATTVADFFAATRLPLAVRGEPRRADAPIGIYATREAVFVTCEGACVTAKLAELLAIRRAAVPGPHTAGPTDLLDSPAFPAAVIPGEPGSPVTNADRTTPHAIDDDWPPAPKLGGFGLPTDVVELAAARLKHLCRLAADRRRPYCSANGIVWLVPCAGTGSEELADQTAAAIRADLRAAEAGLQVHCPSIAVVCDAQEMQGFRDLVRGLPEPLSRERLLGRSFPLVPGVTPEQYTGVLFGGIDWVARHLVPGVAYQRFGSEAEGNGDRWSTANARLWTLSSELYARRAAITRLLGQAFGASAGRPPMLAGVYLAGTGPDEQDQAFAAGIVQWLLGLQNNVTWTPAAEAEERDYRRMQIIGYAAAFALLLAVAGFGYMTWGR